MAMAGTAEADPAARDALRQAKRRVEPSQSAKPVTFLYRPVSFCSAACMLSNVSFTIARHPTWGREQGPKWFATSGFFVGGDS
jgi:hypothetical protein